MTGAPDQIWPLIITKYYSNYIDLYLILHRTIAFVHRGAITGFKILGYWAKLRQDSDHIRRST